MTAPTGAKAPCPVAVMVSLCTLGGMFEPRRIIPHWNFPRSTSNIAAHLRPLETARVRALLERAEKDGMVVCVGTGEQHDRSWNRNAANLREKYWRLTDAALAAFSEVQP